MQLPPEQELLHRAPSSQRMTHEPPAQSLLASASARTTKVHEPAGQLLTQSPVHWHEMVEIEPHAGRSLPPELDPPELDPPELDPPELDPLEPSPPDPSPPEPSPPARLPPELLPPELLPPELDPPGRPSPSSRTTVHAASAITTEPTRTNRATIESSVRKRRATAPSSNSMSTRHAG